MAEIKRIYFPTKEKWREWLERNHVRESKVAVVRYKKHTGRASPSHSELMHEAICFGWIDTTIKRIDSKKYIINFSKRSKNSKWSNNTLRYAKELTDKERMSPEGMKHYLFALKKPTHDAGIPKSPDVPNYLKAALRKDKIAEKNFDLMAPSYRRTLLRWLLRAKLLETREKRVKAIVKMAKNNMKSVIKSIAS
jgi:uncharacterized protein YdeI (YjbR/CyaY-like superfamily)